MKKSEYDDDNNHKKMGFAPHRSPKGPSPHKILPEDDWVMKNIVSKPMLPEKTKISVEEFQAFYRRTPEERSSSRSGLHLGHYKATSFSKEFSTILCLIASIAFDNQYSLIKWCQSATTLLEKSVGNPFLHKYRTIHLLESGLNYIMRIIWGKNFMHHNELGKNFHNNQYGGRKGR